jgi:enoyl-CoA hydratase/carnithine racemase
MTVSSESVLYSVCPNGIATVALNKPEVRNAFDDELVASLLAAFNRAEADDAVRVLVLTSTHEKIFSAGGNLNGFASEETVLQKYQRNSSAPKLIETMMGLRIPVLCALNGHALAGGFGLILGCDLILAKEGVRIGTPEINIGAFPFIISALMMRNIPRKKVMEMLFLGDQMGVEEAQALGVINRVVPAGQFEALVQEWAEKLASKSPLMIKLGKKAFQEQQDRPLFEAFRLLEHYLTLAQNTTDVKEGVAAFMEKRAPKWKGC